MHIAVYKLCTVTWQSTSRVVDLDNETIPPLRFETPVPVGIVQAMKKSQLTAGRNRASFPEDVARHYNICNKAAFDKAKLTVEVSFSGKK